MSWYGSIRISSVRIWNHYYSMLWKPVTKMSGFWSIRISSHPFIETCLLMLRYPDIRKPWYVPLYLKGTQCNAHHSIQNSMSALDEKNFVDNYVTLGGNNSTLIGWIRNREIEKERERIEEMDTKSNKRERERDRDRERDRQVGRQTDRQNKQADRCSEIE